MKILKKKVLNIIVLMLYHLMVLLIITQNFTEFSSSGVWAWFWPLQKCCTVFS